MNRIAFYSATVVLVGVSALLLFRKHEALPKPPDQTSQTGDSQAVNGSPPPHGASATSVPEPVSHQARQGQPPAADTSAKDRITELSNLLQTYSVQLQPTIAFYGKVVDESNRPIEGARIELHWTHLFPPPEHTASTNTLSGPEGLFSLTGVTGATVSVYVSKDGYDYVRSLNQNNFSYSATIGSTPFQADSNNPVLFHLRKKG